MYTKTIAVKKWLSFELICAVYIVTLISSPVVTWYESECGEYLEYIVTFKFVQQYQILLTLYVQYTKKPAVKKWLPFELICAEYIVTLNSYPVVTSCIS